MERAFTIEEIKYYLEGGILAIGTLYGELSDDLVCNEALKNVIHELEDEEDGIEAVLTRKYQSQICKYAEGGVCCHPDLHAGEITKDYCKNICDRFESRLYPNDTNYPV